MPDYRAPCPAALPKRGNALTARLVAWLMQAAGWRFQGSLPDYPQAVVVVAPHTSNWDGIIALPAILALDLRIHAMAKHNLFRFPLGPLLRWFGLMPVQRDAVGGAVASVVAEFARQPALWLGIAPEGTRHGTLQWKTGFHRIARQVGIPIVPVAWDYRSKSIVLGEAFWPEADINADLARLYTFYRCYTPRHPQRLSQPLRLPENTDTHTHA